MDAVTLIDGISHVDLTRCIGCGLCTTTCEPEAMQLQHKEQPVKPAENAVEMYMNMLRNRVGNAQMLIMLTKRLLRMRIL